jgi:hypothetical protein
MPRQRRVTDCIKLKGCTVAVVVRPVVGLPDELQVPVDRLS